MKLCKITNGSIEGLDRISVVGLPKEQISDIILGSLINSMSWTKLMCIGSRIPIQSGKQIDMLAIAPDGKLIVVIFQLGNAPQETVAQIIGSVTWFDKLEKKDIEQIAIFKLKKSLAETFKEFYGKAVDNIGDKMNLILLAHDFSDDVLDAVNFLAERGMLIHCIEYKLFKDNENTILANRIVTDEILEHTHEPEPKTPTYTLPSKLDDEQFIKLIADTLEEKFGTWLSHFKPKRKGAFEIKCSDNSDIISAFIEWEYTESPIMVEIILDKSIDYDGNKRNLLSMIIGTHENPAFVYKFPQWSKDMNFIDKIIQQFEWAKPLLNSILSG